MPKQQDSNERHTGKSFSINLVCRACRKQLIPSSLYKHHSVCKLVYTRSRKSLSREPTLLQQKRRDLRARNLNRPPRVVTPEVTSEVTPEVTPEVPLTLIQCLYKQLIIR